MVMKRHDQGNSLEKAFSWRLAYSLRGRVHDRHGGECAHRQACGCRGSSERIPYPHGAGREREQDCAYLMKLIKLSYQEDVNVRQTGSYHEVPKRPSVTQVHDEMKDGRRKDRVDRSKL